MLAAASTMIWRPHWRSLQSPDGSGARTTLSMRWRMLELNGWSGASETNRPHIRWRTTESARTRTTAGRMIFPRTPRTTPRILHSRSDGRRRPSGRPFCCVGYRRSGGIFEAKVGRSEEYLKGARARFVGIRPKIPKGDNTPYQIFPPCSMNGRADVSLLQEDGGFKRPSRIPIQKRLNLRQENIVSG